MSAVLRLATRGSPLALAQAHLVRESLARAHGWDPEELDELCPHHHFKTTGDRIQDRPLVEAAAKACSSKRLKKHCDDEPISRSIR
jgi:hydroxymethylbilane synthase